jgi:hypothetical protein
MLGCLCFLGGILTIVHFGGGFDLRSTRERPAGDPRKTHDKVKVGEILIIGHFYSNANSK